MSDSEGPKLPAEELAELEEEVIDILKEGDVRATDRVEDSIREVINNAVETQD